LIHFYKRYSEAAKTNNKVLRNYHGS